VYRRFSSHIFLAVILVSLSLPCCFAQSGVNSTAKTAERAHVSGKWQMSWTGRLGTEKCSLDLQQDAGKLKGTFQDQRGSSSLTGTVDGNKISFDVDFKGPRPFTTRFTGTVDGDNISGTSQAIGIGGSGAYLGHGGEIVQPEHPWTAKRVTDEPNPSAQTKSSGSPPRN
jgi:hypothetical protein